jgi:alkylhydroperoxidase family enzyme
VTWVKLDQVSVHLEIVLISAQNRCTVCAKRTTDMEINLGHPTVLLRDVGQVESCVGLLGDSVNLSAR